MMNKSLILSSAAAAATFLLPLLGERVGVRANYVADRQVLPLLPRAPSPRDQIDLRSSDNVWTGRNSFSNVTVQAETEWHYGTESHWGTEAHYGDVYYTGGKQIYYIGDVKLGPSQTTGVPTLWFTQDAPSKTPVAMMFAYRGNGFSFFTGAGVTNYEHPVTINDGAVYADAVLLQNTGDLQPPILQPGQVFYWSSNGVALVTTCGRLGTLKTTALAGVDE